MRVAAGILSGPRSGAWDNHSPLLLCAIRGATSHPTRPPSSAGVSVWTMVMHAERGAGGIERLATAVAESLTGALGTHDITG
jgi:hypothetical protein